MQRSAPHQRQGQSEQRPEHARQEDTFHEALEKLNQRLQREAVLAVDQVESAVSALASFDREAAERVRDRDTEVDREEVRIEEACVELIALHQPVASDLRRLMIVLKVNGDLERIADHASGVAKAVVYLGDEPEPTWPTSLLEMGRRLPSMCHETLRALAQQDESLARSIMGQDDVLDDLAKSVMDEVDEGMGAGALSRRAGLLAFRASRDLERIGDLCSDICEDIVYLRTGKIVRHAGKIDPR